MSRVSTCLNFARSTEAAFMSYQLNPQRINPDFNFPSSHNRSTS